MCCSPAIEYAAVFPDRYPEPDGVCPTCGSHTLDGESLDQCSYSPVICETCNDAPCDGSC